MFSWLKSRRRRQILAEPLSPPRLETLARRVRQYRDLPLAQQERVRTIVQVMLAEKDWAPAAGFELTDEMRVTIAGIAAMMVSGLDEPFYFDRLPTIIVHPTSMRFAQNRAADNPYLPAPNALDGMAQQWGPVIVNWAAVRDERRGPSQGRNVVVHELAHHLDGLNGAMDGSPPMDSGDEAQWLDIVEDELDLLEDDIRRGVDSLIGHDAVESPAEFFAVTSECFFELPHDLRREHPELYEALAKFYCQDPTAWMQR
jgi:Mlc titration factor MtfA (ptsG expression regulator)